ncbi:MAG: tRNA modification GTPase [Treponema sp.]|jgi:tRNA modification GTPase|nr:tRNA modification GTPase [Treponema sp.]
MKRNSGASYGDKDPVFALATGLSGPLALIRTSGGTSVSGEERGENAIRLLSRIFSRPRKLLGTPGGRIIRGWILDRGGKKLDEVLVSVYRAPGTYTGEDGADISCHGGLAVVRAVTESLKSAGFREALPGEFSFRAFMNGKLDLTRCESVMELVNAKTETGRDHAAGRLSGLLYREIAEIKELLVAVLAETELYLDYDEGEAGGGSVPGPGLPGRNRAGEGLARLRALADSWRTERLYQEGALAVIAGRPNAGKSSLFNLLLKEERSIVTDSPGTTRDWIEAALSVEGIPLRLADTAGLREQEGGIGAGPGGSTDRHGTDRPGTDQFDADRQGTAGIDQAEGIGIRRSRELIDRADLVIYVIDGKAGFGAGDAEFLRDLRAKNTPFILLWNKADLAAPPEGSAAGNLLPVSAKTGLGTAGLIRAIGAALQAPAGSDGTVEAAGAAAETALLWGSGLGSARQKGLADAAIAALEEALGLADSGEPLDLIAPLLREGVNALGEITGEVSTADILETMFSRFCVGK